MQHIIYLVLRRMRTPLIVLILSYAISITGFILITGVDDQGRAYRMDLFHAFYFVSFMGSTIGFGELPYPFTGAQRLWTLFTIYATVISWLYAIGTMISLIQARMFRNAFITSAFTRKVKRIRESFYLVCGYGDTGKELVQALSSLGIRCVIVDHNHNRIHELELGVFSVLNIGLAGDAADPSILRRAGLSHPHCIGVIALTRNDEVNLKIAISAKIGNKNRKVFCWAQSHDMRANMESFGTDEVIIPADTFANDLGIALASPSMQLLRDWLSSGSREALTEPVFPPKGLWLLCGFGSFGKALYKRLLAAGMSVRVIEARPDLTRPPHNSVIGRGTEADTLIEAEVKKAVGIIATTNHDVNNLSIIITARELNPHLFTVARQESSTNGIIFEAAKIDLIGHHSDLISSRILARITTPLTTLFLTLAQQQDENWARLVISRLVGLLGDTMPRTWGLSIRPRYTPAIYTLLDENTAVKLGALLSAANSHASKPQCMALLLQRGKTNIILPDDDQTVLPDDRFLFTGDSHARADVHTLLHDATSLRYHLTGVNKPTSIIGKWLAKN